MKRNKIIERKQSEGKNSKSATRKQATLQDLSKSTMNLNKIIDWKQCKSQEVQQYKVHKWKQ